MNNSVISEGDNVLIFLDSKRTYLIKAQRDQRFHTHKGFIDINDLINKRYGDRVKSSLGIDFFLLQPTIYDYTRKMIHATQIIYPKDIALIIVYTAIGPGSKVVEAGTGSGALTSVIANYIRPSGKVYSYEIRPEFQIKAHKNLERSGVLEYVELKNGDVTLGIDERNVDAVILDLATPWQVVPHVYEALKGGGAFVSFSPTIEQVVKTVEALRDYGFIDLETIECLVRNIKVKLGETRPDSLMRGHTGYITSGRKAFKL